MAILDRLRAWLSGNKDTKRCPRCNTVISREFTTCPSCSASLRSQG